MLEPWNNAFILPPPVHTALCDNNIDVKGLTCTCTSMKKVLSKQLPLHSEGAIFSRILYKFDKKFRNDLGFRIFKKVNTALRRYLTLNLLKDLENFTMALPGNDDELYMPTRQMLEYILVRLITFSKIMLRICVCSKQAAIFYLDRVKRGESHWMSLMPYATLSRVWAMSKVLLQHACNWYLNFYPFLDKLQHKGLDFLPPDYNLPINLEEWLELKNIDDFGRFEWSQKKEQLVIDPGLVEDEDGDRFDSILEYVNEVNSEENQEVLKMRPSNVNDCEQIKISTLKNIDQGVPVSRDSFNTLLKAIPVTVPKITHYAERVTNKDSLHKFMTTEEKLRTEGSSQSLSSHLSFMQWQALKNSLQKLYDSLANNRKIERKFKKVWKEKCLDCK